MAKPDWEAIESAYLAGALSLHEIGVQFGATKGAIRKRAKKLEWAARHAKLNRIFSFEYQVLLKLLNMPGRPLPLNLWPE